MNDINDDRPLDDELDPGDDEEALAEPASAASNDAEADDTDDAYDTASDSSPRKSAARRDDGSGRGNGRPRRRRRRRTKPDDYLPEDDERAMRVLAFMTDVIDQMEMDCNVRLRRPKSDDARNEIGIEIYGRDAGRVIGKKGQVLSALQFLAHRVVNRPGLERRPILVDAEGYRSRRDSSLASMARRLGKQAVDEGKIITFEPMNPRDRRVVHVALAKFEGVITKSDGEGDSRRVQIIPVRRQES
jgi:spoIIIJ-associated protein